MQREKLRPRSAKSTQHLYNILDLKLRSPDSQNNALSTLPYQLLQRYIFIGFLISKFPFQPLNKQGLGVKSKQVKNDLNKSKQVKSEPGKFFFFTFNCVSFLMFTIKCMTTSKPIPQFPLNGHVNYS